MNIYALFKQDGSSRMAVVTVQSYIGIVVNLIIAIIKISVGLVIASMAIVSEGINNASDALSSLLTLVGTKLAAMKPTHNYPFGFGRIEYLTSLLIGIIILVAGAELLIDSCKLIFTPSVPEISYATLALIAISAIIKLAISSMQISEGRRVGSDSLIAVGKEGQQDSLGSVITLASGLLFLLWGYNIDAYASLLISLMVLKVGLEVLYETIKNLLGHPADKELADRLYQVIRSEPLVINAADMLLHNYGPDRYSGSVNIEIDHKVPLGEIYKIIHALQLRIMYEFHIVMVFGLYAVDNDNPAMKAMRQRIAEFISTHEHLYAYHALYIDEAEKSIYIDFLVDYELQDWHKLRREFKEYMQQHYPGYKIELVIETEYI